MKKVDDGLESFESSNDFVMGRVVNTLQSNILEIDSFSESDLGKTTKEQ